MAEMITRADFDARLAAGELALTLIAMSNIGKSHWAGRLVRGAHFRQIGCDDLIQAKMAGVLHGAGFSPDIDGMASWMGQPYDPQFRYTQATYLELEALTMHEAIEQIAVPSLGGNTVVDTTGSVVYMDRDIYRDLTLYSTVVYLAASPEQQAMMLARYLEKPKPVVWGDVFEKRRSESRKRALERCYPRLLNQRSRLYEQMAQVTIPADIAQALSEPDEFLAHIRQGLPVAV